jgi:uncharacterized membrane protein YhaH (DUF805 family)
MSGFDVYVLPPNSPFAVEVFKTIGPRIPRGKWPVEAMHVTFTPSADGMRVIGYFKDLPAPYDAVASHMVAQAGIKLVLLSPVAYLAAALVRAKRWRDACMYAAVPLLFAIPIMRILTKAAMVPVVGLFLANLAALVVTQGVLSHRRGVLVNTRFVADVPVPGLRLGGAMRDEPAHSLPLDGDEA